MEIENGVAAVESSVADSLVPDAGGPGASAPPPPVTGADDQAGGDPAGAPPPAAYQPNFKYKVLKEEKEIPEWLRSAITTPELEKKAKDIFERADGIEAVKQHRDALVQENTHFRSEVVPFVRAAETALAHLKRGDLDTFFEQVGVSEQQVFQYALRRIQLKENPALAQQHEAQRHATLENQQLQQQVQEYSSGYQELAVQQRSMQLDMHLQAGEVAQQVKAFDDAVGKPGSFRKEVILRAQAHAAAGNDVPVDQAVAEVLSLIRWQGAGTPQPAPGQAVTQGQATGGTPVAQSAKPTLPHLQGKGTSPVQKAITSTAGLRERARALEAAGS